MWALLLGVHAPRPNPVTYYIVHGTRALYSLHSCTNSCNMPQVESCKCACIFQGGLARSWGNLCAPTHGCTSTGTGTPRVATLEARRVAADHVYCSRAAAPRCAPRACPSARPPLLLAVVFHLFISSMHPPRAHPTSPGQRQPGTRSYSDPASVAASAATARLRCCLQQRATCEGRQACAKVLCARPQGSSRPGSCLVWEQ